MCSDTGKGSQGFPIRPVVDYKGLLGLLKPYWAALALMAYMTMKATGPDSLDATHINCPFGLVCLILSGIMVLFLLITVWGI